MSSRRDYKTLILLRQFGRIVWSIMQTDSPYTHHDVLLIASAIRSKKGSTIGLKYSGERLSLFGHSRYIETTKFLMIIFSLM
jgi:hypothetical protein